MDKPLIKLRGTVAAQFVEFMRDAYPEITVEKSEVVEIFDNTPLFKAWQEFDEYCG